uniref:Uncharacterized protein n=1 Tax=Arundo donax TaxID=35708 RepID=A0A0A9H285_ARUDO
MIIAELLHLSFM